MVAKGWRPLGQLRRAGQFFFALSFSSLTRRIVSLNLAGLVALVASVLLYLRSSVPALIDARAQSSCRPAEIISAAIASPPPSTKYHYYRSRPAARSRLGRDLQRPYAYSGWIFRSIRVVAPVSNR